VLPDLVTRNDAGELLTVRYDQLMPLLLSEVQAQRRELETERKKNAELEEKITELKRLGARQSQ
jgi:hypothetical protein